MQFYNWLLCLLFTVTVYAADAQPPTELQIDTTYKPETCSLFAKSGDLVKVHYTGTLFSTGAKFDSSSFHDNDKAVLAMGTHFYSLGSSLSPRDLLVDRGQPLPLKLGVGQVIKGWDEGLQGMCVGEKRTLTIPADKAYGARGFGSVIPPNSALVFTTELVELNNIRDEL
ncbi:hypothetical protein D9758_005842 [Tetrapyrgos nigripes]|uniref:peptidylprolyl isomerase n=1 Tax=Tetrapyrgos nigripes TaxID=182062 RepID=A0A8H5G320_9AGAR|nr:hypothetical protein D9758_005842 [Tetrapyrgos nigripes]